MTGISVESAGSSLSGGDRPPAARTRGRIAGTAILRIGFSLVFVTFYLAAGHLELGLFQCGHLVSSIAVLLSGLLTSPGSRFGALSRGLPAAYYRTLSDVVQVALGVHATGGLDSPILVGLAAPVVFSALGQSAWRARVAAAAAVVLAALSESAGSFGFLPDINLLGRGPTPSTLLQLAVVASLLAIALFALAEVIHRLYASGLRAGEEAEQARSEAELDRDRAELALEETERVANLAREANASEGLEGVLGVLASFAREDLRASRFFFLMVNEAQTELEAHSYMRDGAFVALDEVPEILRRVSLVPYSGTLYRTFSKQRLLYLHRVQELPVGPVDEILVRTFSPEWMVQLPLVLAGRVVAIVAMSGEGTRRIARYHLNLLEKMGLQVVGAVHRARLLRVAEEARANSERSRGETEVLAEFSRRLNESTDLGALAQEVFAHLRARYGLTRTALLLVDAAETELTTLAWDTADQAADFWREFRAPLVEATGSLWRTYKSQKPLYLPKIPAVPFGTVDRAIVEANNLSSFLHVPLVAQGRTVGVVLSGLDRKLARADIRSIASLCHQIAGGIQKARLLADVTAAQAHSEQMRRRVEKLNQFSKRINATTDLSQIVDSVFAYLTEEYGFDGYMLMKPEAAASGPELRVWRQVDHVRPVSVHEYCRALSIPLDGTGGMIERAFGRKKPLFIPDVEVDIFRRPYPGMERDREMIERMLLRGFLLLPLVVQDQPVAVVLCGSVGVLELDRATRASIGQFAEQIAGAFHTTELLARVENERDRAEALRQEAESAREETQKLSEYAKRINETDELEPILDEIFAYLASRFGARDIVLQMVDAAHRELRTIRCTSDRDHQDIEFAMGLRIPMNEKGGTLFRTFQKQKPFYMPRILGYPSELDRLIVETLRFDSLAQFPLVIQQETIGMLWLSFGSERKSRAVIDSIARFCEQIAGALRGADLLRAARSARMEAETAHGDIERMAEVTRRLNENPDVASIAEGVFAYLNERFDLNGSVLLLVDDSRREIRAAAIAGSSAARIFWEQFRAPLTPDSGSLFRTYERQKPLYFRRSPRPLPGSLDARIVEANSLHSFLQIPLVVQEKTVGIVVSVPDRPLRGKELEAIVRLCDQIAGAVQNARFLEESRVARRDSEVAHRKSQQLADMSRRLNETTNLQVIADEALRFLLAEYNLEKAVLLLVDQAGQHLEMVAHTPLSPEEAAWGRAFRPRLEAASGSLFRTFSTQKPLYLSRVPDRMDSLVDEEIVRILKLESFVHLPLVVQGGTVGIVFAQRARHERPLKRSEVQALRAFADQIAGAVHTSQLLRQTEAARSESDRLLTSILPARVAAELKSSGHVEPLFYDSVTVLFTDFVGFTEASQKMMPDELVQELDGCFSQFDEVVLRNNLEKLKTIGDAYMCAAGLPAMNQTHPVDACLTALEFRAFMRQMGEIKTALGVDYWQIRIGLHSGPVTAGVIGTSKFAYDIWGDTVNTASRMESSGAPGCVNISGSTYGLVKGFFVCEHRGRVQAKGKGELDMYFLERIRPELSADPDGLAPNAEFHRLREQLEFGAAGVASGSDGYTL